MKLFLSLVVCRSINGLHYNLLPVHNEDGSLLSHEEVYEMLMRRDHYLAVANKNNKGLHTINESGYKALAEFAYGELPLALNVQMYSFIFLTSESLREVEYYCL